MATGQNKAAQTGGAGRLVAVVITWNRLEPLKVTLARLLDTPVDVLSGIVVVDNASTDDTAAWLATQSDPRLSVITNATNTGGAGGFDRGMRHAVAHFDPDWLVVMDDDARPEPGALAAFHALDLAQVEGVAAAVYLPEGEICEMNRPSRNPFDHRAEFWRTLRQGRAGFHLGPEAYAGTARQMVDVTSFVGFFVSRKGIALAGYPDPGLFLYGDDGLYTLGLRNAGGRIAFEPSVRFEHALSTFAGQRGRFRPLWKVYYYHRNLMLLYRLAAGAWFWPAMIIILPKWLSKTRHHTGEKRVFLGLMLRAIRDGLARRTSVSHAQVLHWAGQTAPVATKTSPAPQDKTP